MSLGIVVGEEARARLASGLRLVVRAVAPSLGPCGRALVFHHPPAPPGLVFDGYAIAREVAPTAGIEALGAQLLKDTLFQLDRDLGDGTSSAAVIVGTLMQHGLKAVVAGFDPRQLSARLLALSRVVTRGLHEQSREAPDGALAGVARSAARDPEIAEAVHRASIAVGAEGFVRITEGRGRAIEARFATGTSLRAKLCDRGFSDRDDRLEIRLERPYVLVADEEIETFGKLTPVLEGFATSGKSLLIIARKVAGEALGMLLRSKREQGLRVIALQAVDFGDKATEALRDMAIVSGAGLIGAHSGTTVERLRPHMLGRAEEVSVDGGEALLVGGAGAGTAIEGRRGELRRAIERERYLALDREILQERLARISGGVVRLEIGGDSELERAARVAAARRGMAAVSAARRGGILPGGGTALARAARGLLGAAPADPAARAAHTAATAGLRAVARQLIRNAGHDPGPWLARIELGGTAGKGLDVNRMRICDLVAASVVDPSEVVRAEVERAFSISALLLCSEGGVAR